MNDFINIGGRLVGPGNPVYIIAEIGSNHDGDFGKAKELIRACKYAGADACKFQSFTAEGLLNPLRPDDNGGWVLHQAYPVIDRLSLPEDWHPALMEFSREIGIAFLSAPFEAGRAELLNNIGIEAFKIASGELTNEPLLRLVASFGKPVVLSTGAAYLDEVRRAVEVLEGSGNTRLALLHCASLYPPAFDEVNIRAMVTLNNEFGCPVGFSDHTPGDTAPLGAVALGASIIEKHITLDKKSSGPDHSYATDVEEFRRMAVAIRNLERALGDGIKRPSKGEMSERIGARRSVYAAADIKKNDIITVQMLKLVRHAYGLAPGQFDAIIGGKAVRDIRKDMLVKKEDICL